MATSGGKARYWWCLCPTTSDAVGCGTEVPNRLRRPSRHQAREPDYGFASLSRLGGQVLQLLARFKPARFGEGQFRR